jgi:hypothetical protein
MVSGRATIMGAHAGFAASFAGATSATGAHALRASTTAAAVAGRRSELMETGVRSKCIV